MSLDEGRRPERRLLVTGGSGFIGTNLVAAAVGHGWAILNLDIAPPKDPGHGHHWRQVDVLDRPSLNAAFDSFRPDLVVHLAARTDLDELDSLNGYAVNIDGVANVIDAIGHVGSVERVQFVSSRLVFDLGYTPSHERDYHASTLYGESKARGEELVREASGLQGWTILRPSGIWGPWFEAPYRHLFAAIRRGVYVHPGNRMVRKSYGYVENSVHQMKSLAAAPLADIEKRTFWIADRPVDVRAWTQTIQSALDAPRIRTAPVGLLRAAAVLGDVAKRVGLPAPMTRFRLNNMVTDMIFDTSELEAVVGPPPFSPEQGVARTVAWLRSRRP